MSEIEEQPTQINPLSDLNGELVPHSESQPIVDGTQQLLVKVSEIIQNQEPDAVRKLLKNILVDKEGNPLEERIAVFEMLSVEQKSLLKDRVVVAGGQMIHKLSEDNSKTKFSLDESALSVGNRLRLLPDQHNQEVGSAIRRGNIRLAAVKQDDLEAGSRRAIGAIEGHSELVRTWDKNQQGLVDGFEQSDKQARDHERAIDEARKTLDLEHEDTTLDISLVFDENALVNVASKLSQAIMEAKQRGEDPMDRVLTMLEVAPDKDKDGLIRQLRIFTANYRSTTKLTKTKVQSHVDDLSSGLKRFIAKGKDGYIYARNLDEAGQLYKTQQRALEASVDTGANIVRLTTAGIDDANREIGRVQKGVYFVDSKHKL